MKQIITLFFLINSCVFINAQSTSTSDKDEQTGLSEAEYQKAITAYLDMTHTETYKANKAAMSVFSEKIGKNDIPEDLIEEETWRKWITENLSKTNFKSVDEAMKLRQLGLDLTTKLALENIELYDMIKKASKEQRHEILRPERNIIRY